MDLSNFRVPATDEPGLERREAPVDEETEPIGVGEYCSLVMFARAKLDDILLRYSLGLILTPFSGGAENWGGINVGKPRTFAGLD